MKVDCDQNDNIYYVTRNFEKIRFLYREKILGGRFAQDAKVKKITRSSDNSNSKKREIRRAQRWKYNKLRGSQNLFVQVLHKT